MEKFLQISVPSKTFLCGEYLALQGGLSVILGTQPRFVLRVQKKTEANKIPPPFHPDSPAGKLRESNLAFFEQFEFDFIDPHNGKGGFGASSAQFVLLSAFLQARGNLWNGAEDLIDQRQMLATYRSSNISGNAPPSGSDVICHLQGGICFFERRTGLLSRVNWPFLGQDFALLKTSYKTSTHSHLSDLFGNQSQKPILSDGLLDLLQKSSLQVADSLRATDFSLFCEGLRQYTQILASTNLQIPDGLQLKQKLEDISGVSVAKPCGALGSDVIFVVFEASKREQVFAKAIALGLEWVAESKDLSNGFSVDKGQHLDARVVS